MGKNDYIGLRISPDERKRFLTHAIKKNYRSISDFVLTILRKFYKEAPKKDTNQ